MTAAAGKELSLRQHIPRRKWDRFGRETGFQLSVVGKLSGKFPGPNHRPTLVDFKQLLHAQTFLTLYQCGDAQGG